MWWNRTRRPSWVKVRYVLLNQPLWFLINISTPGRALWHNMIFNVFQHCFHRTPTHLRAAKNNVTSSCRPPFIIIILWLRAHSCIIAVRLRRERERERERIRWGRRRVIRGWWTNGFVRKYLHSTGNSSTVAQNYTVSRYYTDSVLYNTRKHVHRRWQRTFDVFKRALFRKVMRLWVTVKNAQGIP